MDRLRVLCAYPLLAFVSAGKSSKLIAYVDGAARGNPGPAAAGVVLQDAGGVDSKTWGLTRAGRSVAERSAGKNHHHPADERHQRQVAQVGIAGVMVSMRMIEFVNNVAAISASSAAGVRIRWLPMRCVTRSTRRLP